MTASASRVIVRNLRKNYGAVEALRGMSLDLAGGTVLGLAGPNGSGKSTLGRIVAGFAQPSSGVATIDGIPSHSYRIAHGVGYQCEESARKWRDVTGRELLSLRNGDDELRDAADLLTILEMAPLLDRAVHTLSKGQWRLVQAAYALLARGVVVLDEPDAGLDPIVLERLRAAIAHCAGMGTSVLVLSHHLDELMLMASRIAFVHAGTISGEADTAGLDATSIRTLYRAHVRDTA